jgi:hypothetical protein
LLGGKFVSIGFWSYLGLTILGFIALGAAYWKTKARRLFILYFAVSGLTYFFDYIIYVWGKAYIYHPGIIEGRFDSHIGGIINGHILPSFAVLYVAFQFKWHWSIALAAFFTCIEVLFKAWGIYESNWWNHWYTFSILIFYFPLVNIWWRQFTRNPHKILFLVSLFFIYYSIFIPLNIGLYGMLQLRTLHVDWLERLHIDSTAFTTFTASMFGSILAYVTIRNDRMLWYFLVMIGFIVYDILLKFTGIVETDHIITDSILSLCTFIVPMFIVKYAGTNNPS